MYRLLFPIVLSLAPRPDAPPPAAKSPPATAASAGTPAADLGALVDRVQKRYDETADLRAHFTQNVTRAAFSRTVVKTGEVFIKKPGKFRLQYDGEEKELYVSTGRLVWYFQPDDHQAFRQELKSSQLPAALSFLMGKGKLKEEFEINFAKDVPYGGSKDYKLSLKPKQPQATYRSIYFVVDPDTYFVKQSVLVSAQGDINSFSFSDIQVNQKLGEDLFKFTPPKDVRVQDYGKIR